MVVVDTNVLLYAANRSAPQHAAAAGWLNLTLSGNETVGLPWVAVLGFVRIATHPRIFDHPLTADEALTLVEAWLSHPRVTAPEPTPRHLAVVAGLLRSSGTAGNLTTDAHLAAIALEHGAAVASFDRDFARFDVTVVVPAA